jgi:ketosteroid isomerase-like protein
MKRPLLNATPAFAAVMLAAACATNPTEREHAALVAAERAFAKHADDADIRTAFRAAFAADAVWMVPSPMRLEEAYAGRPTPADPRAARLQWDPVISGIAASGDFGFTSGPSVFSLRDHSRPPGYGAYFSMWKRDGRRWRVALDAGIQSPAAIPREALQPSPRVPPAPGGTARDARPPSAIERAQPWSIDALGATLSSDARFYREGPPVHGNDAIRAAVAAVHPMALEPAGGETATSADLAYTYGAWRSGSAKGHYVHLWTRDPRGDWKIALIVHL